MKKEYFTDYPPFINRKKEQEFLMNYFHNAPKNNLFLYGPKSTGKTTLIKRILKKLDPEKYDISFFNMREHLVTDFISFRSIFFPDNLKDQTKKGLLELVSGSKISFPGFSWEGSDIPTIKKDIFKVLIQKLEKLKSEGIKPVIVLDEFQYLRDIFIDDQEKIRLIEELFKFFIALTKQNNLAHVVCLTSDSYYMEELYNNTKLVNTSKFELIDHLSKKDIYYWLGEKENCPEEMVENIWENLGGSVWEIWQVFVAYKNTGNWKNELDDLLQVKYSLMKEYIINGELGKWRDDFFRISKFLVKDGSYTRKITKEDEIMPLIRDLVSKDFWFYDMKQNKITANSQSIEKGLERILKEV